jgi:hypothetical protein
MAAPSLAGGHLDEDGAVWFYGGASIRYKVNLSDLHNAVVSAPGEDQRSPPPPPQQQQQQAASSKQQADFPPVVVYPRCSLRPGGNRMTSVAAGVLILATWGGGGKLAARCTISTRRLTLLPEELETWLYINIGPFTSRAAYEAFRFNASTRRTIPISQHSFHGGEFLMSIMPLAVRLKIWSIDANKCNKRQ